MSILEANIAALRSVGSDLPGRLVDPSSAPHLVNGEDGILRLRIHRTLVNLRLPAPTIEGALSALHMIAPDLGGVVDDTCNAPSRVMPLSVDALKVLRHYRRAALNDAVQLDLRQFSGRGGVRTEYL